VLEELSPGERGATLASRTGPAHCRSDGGPGFTYSDGRTGLPPNVPTASCRAPSSEVAVSPRIRAELREGGARVPHRNSPPDSTPTFPSDRANGSPSGESCTPAYRAVGQVITSDDDALPRELYRVASSSRARGMRRPSDGIGLRR
jgi:hypothetical protein